MILLAAGNPFITAYVQSDWFGKLIFWGLFLLSALSWTLLIHKAWIFIQVRKLSAQFSDLFSEKDPLNLQFTRPKGRLLEVPHPFFEMYKTLKQKTLQLISRNHLYLPNTETVLSEADLGLIDAQVQTALAGQHKLLEKNLFLLSTIATLGPFLGLLGTVWGILLTFSQLHSRGISASNAAMLSGLSMALATTVIGLVIAIPAFAGYNYLKNAAREYRRDMEDFSQLLIAAIELQYRRPDHAQKIPVAN
ncbi:MAG: MotA/TolQ/ExbB proton channel family protein [Parachlamydiales bacterium]|nr:MotA/TolQ/ExbB proton channel family protein [Parachlamydiales bacterium]